VKIDEEIHFLKSASFHPFCSGLQAQLRERREG